MKNLSFGGAAALVLGLVAVGLVWWTSATEGDASEGDGSSGGTDDGSEEGTGDSGLTIAADTGNSVLDSPSLLGNALIAGAEFGVNPRWLMAILHQEGANGRDNSPGYPNGGEWATGKTGERGPTQILAYESPLNGRVRGAWDAWVQAGNPGEGKTYDDFNALGIQGNELEALRISAWYLSTVGDGTFLGSLGTYNGSGPTGAYATQAAAWYQRTYGEAPA